MLSEGKANIIKSIERAELSGQTVEILHFFSGQALVLAHQAIAFYNDAAAIEDPLGKGLISMAELPAGRGLPETEPHWVAEHAAGFVGLFDGRVILILPNAIRLFADKSDALRNRNLMVELAVG